MAALAAILALVAPGRSAAHDQPYSFIDVRIERGAVGGVVTAHIEDLAHEIGLEDPKALLVAEVATARAAEIVSRTSSIAARRRSNWRRRDAKERSTSSAASFRRGSITSSSDPTTSSSSWDCSSSAEPPGGSSRS